MSGNSGFGGENIREEVNMPGVEDNHRALLELRGITKEFPGVRALDNVSFDLRKGEVHVLLGENGAGKSTLIKILSGAYLCDEGEIYFDGRSVNIRNPADARELGVSVIYQHLDLVPHLDVAGNIFLGREPTRNSFFKFLDRKRIYSEAFSLLKSLTFDLDPHALVGNLSIGKQQLVAIAKAIQERIKVLILDEPTASLNKQEVSYLFKIIARLKNMGVGMVYISHRLEEVFQIGDRITVLRDGHKVNVDPINAKDTSREALISMMIGRRLESEFPVRQKCSTEEEVLRTEGLTRRHAFYDIDLSVCKGEIVGIAGLVGAGGTELLRAIIGADPIDSGKIVIKGRVVDPRSPGDTIKLGLGFLPEDRHKQALFLKLAVTPNVSLASLSGIVKCGLLNLSKEKTIVADYVDRLKIKAPSLRVNVINLSGGNQQKVVLARWLCSKSDILLFDEPTHGLDVGVKVDVHSLLDELARQGMAIIVNSSELREILAMSDRVQVMRKGRIAAEFSKEEATQEKILESAL